VIRPRGRRRAAATDALDPVLLVGRDLPRQGHGIAGDHIRSFVERIEQLDTELQEISEQKKEVFAEAKGEGFDVKVLKEIIRLRKQDKDERDEHETLLDVYMRAMDMATPAPVAEAA
jgi:uncharacterized protein (UPF0335 family)